MFCKGTKTTQAAKIILYIPSYDIKIQFLGDILQDIVFFFPFLDECLSNSLLVYLHLAGGRVFISNTAHKFKMDTLN